MITHEHLRDVLNYDPETGVFTWRKTRPNGRQSGEVAGRVTMGGYVQVTIYKKQYYGHRLAWFYMTGEWPKKDLDHTNCVRSDNRWANLREATRTQNCANRSLAVTNTSGFKGVRRSPLSASNPWRATITRQGRKIHLGQFKTPEEAHAAYVAAAQRLHGDYARAA